jgi:hypothetical protein
VDGSTFLTDEASKRTIKAVRRDYIDAMAVETEDDDADDEGDDEDDES